MTNHTTRTEDEALDEPSLAGLAMPSTYSPSVEDLDGLPRAMAAVIHSKGSVASLTNLYELLNTWGEAQRLAVLEAARIAAAGSEASRQSGATLAEWNENAKVLLDSYPKAVRSCYKGGPENLVESICITFIGMRDALAKANALK